MRPLWPALAVSWLLCAAAVLAAPSQAHARSSFGIQLNLSLDVPLGIYADSVTVLQSTELEAGSVDLPYIADLSHQGGIGLGATLIFREVEVVVALHVLPFDQAILRYEGDRAATLSSPTRVNDAGVTYRKLDQPVAASLPEGAQDSLFLTVVGAGYRVYLNEGFFEPYFPVGGGLALVNLSPSIASRIGVQLWTGVGVDFVVEDLALALDLRYHYTLTNNAFGTQQGADNARVTGDNVLEALTSDLHMITMNIGVRYSFN